MKRLIHVSFLLLLSLAAVQCEKIQEPVQPTPQTETPEKEKVFTVNLETGEVTLQYNQTIEIPYSAEGTDFKTDVTISFKDKPTGIDVSNRYDSGKGVLIITSTRTQAYVMPLEITFRHGTRSYTATLKVSSPGTGILSFADGTLEKEYTILDGQRYAEIGISNPGNLKISTEGGITAQRVGDTLVVYVARNTTDGTLEKSVTMTNDVPGSNTLSIKIHQLSAKDPKNLKHALLALERALGFDSSKEYAWTYEGDRWMHSGNKKWDENIDLIEWGRIMPKEARNCPYLVTNEKMCYGLDEQWGLRLDLDDYDGKSIPDEFFDGFEFIFYFDCEKSVNGTIIPGFVKINRENSAKIWSKNLEYIDMIGVSCHIDNLNNASKLKFMRIAVPDGAEFPSDMSNLTNLQTIRIFGGLSGILPDSFYKLTSLEVFDTPDTNLGGTLSKEIKNLTRLKEFFVSDCKFRGTIPEEFGLLPELTGLYLNNNEFDCTDLPEMFRYRPFIDGGWEGEAAWVPSMIYSVKKINENGKLEPFDLNTPRWFWDRCGAHEKAPYSQYVCTLASTSEKQPHYPYADDLQYPAYEYYYDGKDWRHPNYEHPARYYHQVDGKWTYDPEWDAMEVVVPGDWHENVFYLTDELLEKRWEELGRK